MDLYPYPVTTSHKYGWWMKEGSVPTWAKNERHAHVNSEMTRLVLYHSIVLDVHFTC